MQRIINANHHVSRRTQGTVLAGVLVSAAILALLGLSLIGRSVHGSRVASWSRDHLVLRNLTESAAEGEAIGEKFRQSCFAYFCLGDVDRVRDAIELQASLC